MLLVVQLFMAVGFEELPQLRKSSSNTSRYCTVYTREWQICILEPKKLSRKICFHVSWVDDGLYYQNWSVLSTKFARLFGKFVALFLSWISLWIEHMMCAWYVVLTLNSVYVEMQSRKSNLRYCSLTAR